MTRRGFCLSAQHGGRFWVPQNRGTTGPKSAERPPLLTVRTGHMGSPPPSGRGWVGIWACFPRDHPARWPATELQLRAAEPAGGCQDASFGWKGPAGPQADSVVDPWVAGVDPLRCLARSPVLSWEQRLRGVQPLVNGPPAGRGEGVAAGQTGEAWQREAL